MGYTISTNDEENNKSAVKKPAGSSYSGFGYTISSNADEAQQLRQKAASAVKINADTEAAVQDAARKNSLSYLATETIKGLPAAAGTVAKRVVTHPLETFKDVLFGAINAIPVNYDLDKGTFAFGDGNLATATEKSLWYTAMGKDGVSKDTIDSLYDQYMSPDRKAIEQGFKIGALSAPWMAAESAAMKGLQYAAPAFVKNHAVASWLFSQGVAGLVTGQTVVDPKATLGERAAQAPIDAAGGVAFGAALKALGPAANYAKNTVFRVIRGTRFGEGAIVEPLGTAGKVGKDTPTSVVTTKEGDLSVATNNFDAMQNYIKGSGRTNIVLEQKTPGSLGMTREGAEVMARHVYNPKSQTHTFYVSSEADAATIAHEWGHYINDEVAKQTRGLSTYLFGDSSTIKNVQGIEDTLRAMATKDIFASGAKTATPEAIDAKMSELISAIRSEVRTLAKARPGVDPRTLKGASAFSEGLADATSETLTGAAANRRTTYYRFLQESKAVDDELVKALRGQGKAEKIAEQGQNKQETSLQKAMARQKAATDEKLGMGDKAPERAQRPPNRKYEPSKSESEEVALREVPQRLVARTEPQLTAAIKKAKIPGKNLAQINVGGKKPVTLVVHEIDGTILRAINAGAGSKYMTYAVRAVMREFGFSKRMAESYIAKRFKELKAFAEHQANDQQFVLSKAVRGGAKEGPTQKELNMPEQKPKTPEELKAEQDKQLDIEAAGEAQYYTLAEMDMAEAGSRIFKETGEVIAKPSTFPKWVPEHLRDKDLFNKVSKLIEDGTQPAPNATRQKELYDIVKAQIEERTPQYRDGQMGEFEDIRMKEDARLAEERAAAEGEYNTMMGTSDEAPRTLGEAEAQPTQVNLDRMDTGRKPATDPMRAEKMTNYADEEVFLNTKVLPKITGKERIQRTNADIIDQAQLSKIETADQYLDLLHKRVGALTPDVRAGFNVMMEKAGKIQDMLRYRTPEGGVGFKSADEMTGTELATFKNELAQMVQMFETYSGIRTESSNLLRSFGIAHQRGEDDVLRSLVSRLQKSGLMAEDDAFKVLKGTYQQVTKEKTWYEKFYTTLFGAWLSGPATTVRNMQATLGNIASDIGSKAGNPKLWKELPDTIANLPKNFTEGIKEGKAVFKGDKQVGYDPNSILDESTFHQGDKALYLRAAETVGRFLNAQDMTMAKATQLTEAKAIRIYKPDISEEVAKAVSEAYSIASVYRGMPKGKIIGGLVQGAETATREAPVLKLFIPFIRTVGNALDRQFDYMPIVGHLRATEKFLGRQADDIVKKYALKDPGARDLVLQRLKDQQTGRAYMGLAITAGAAGLAATGNLSGNGPDDYNERLMLERTGWRRNSIKVGNVWIPYTYIGPLAGTLSLVGNMHDAIEYNNANDKSVSEMLGAGMIGWGRTQLSISFFKGTADLFNAIMGNTNAGTYLERLGTGLVPIPNLYTQSLNMTKNVYSHIVGDPSLRQQYETRNAVDMIRLKLGLTGSILGMPALNPRSDMFGAPLTLDFIYGISPTSDKTEQMPVEAMLIEHGIPVTIPQRGQTYSIKGKERALTDTEYTAYVRTSGKYIYESLTQQYDTLRHLPPSQLSDRVEAISRTARARARQELVH